MKKPTPKTKKAAQKAPKAPVKKKTVKKKATVKPTAKTKAKGKALVKEITDRHKHANETSFKAGNDFWLRRATHGRKAIFEKPEILWECACEYFQYVKETPWKKNELVKSGKLAGKIIAVDTEKPMSIKGLCIFLGVNTTYFNEFVEHCGPEFTQIITDIRDIIYTQKLEGAAVGAFNASIIARDLQLVDKTDITTQGEKIASTPMIKVIHTGVGFADSEDKIDTDKQEY